MKYRVGETNEMECRDMKLIRQKITLGGGDVTDLKRFKPIVAPVLHPLPEHQGLMERCKRSDHF